MAAMDLEDEEDIWANTASSPSASPPRPVAAPAVSPYSAFISTQLSLSSRLHLLSSAADAGGSSPSRSLGGGAADGGGPRNAAVFPASIFYDLDATGGVAPLHAGASCGLLEDEMCPVPAAPPVVAWDGSGVGGADRRKKRMIKNRESAARSRARKQAQFRELEKEVAHLHQENQSLRIKYEQLRMSLEVAVPVKKTLQRMPSAPF